MSQQLVFSPDVVASSVLRRVLRRDRITIRTHSGERMRIIKVQSEGILSEQARKSLEAVFFRNSEEAVQTVQQAFPNHLVFKLGDTIEVANKDATIKAAYFQVQNNEPVVLEMGFRSLK